MEIHTDRISALVETQKFLDILTSLPNMWSPNQGYIFFKKAVRDGGIKIIPCKEFWEINLYLHIFSEISMNFKDFLEIVA